MDYSNKRKISDFVFEYRITNVIIFIGILLPIVQFIFNRSLWTDEARLALDIINTSSLNLLKPLDSGAAGTILFLLLEKFFSNLIPNSEYGLRILPLLCYLTSLFFFYNILKQIFSNHYTIIFALSLYVFNINLILYSSEVKPYICDVLMITSIYYFMLRKYDKIQNRYYIMVIIGTIGIFLSYVSSIILFSCSIYYFYISLIKKKLDYRHVGAIFSFWALTYLAYYYFFIYNHPSQDMFNTYWANMNTFMPINPFTVDFLQFHFNKIKMIFSQLISVGITGRYFLAILYLVGIISLIYKNNYEITILLVFPIIIHLLISGFELYPFDLRLILYIIPTIIIVTSYGFEYFNNMIFKDLKIDRLRFLSILIPFSILSLTPWYAFPLKREEIKESISYIKSKKIKNDKVYVYYGAMNAYKYYDKIGFANFSPTILGTPNRQNKLKYIEDLKKLKGNYWLLISHDYNNEEEYIITQLDSLGYNKIESFHAHGSSTYLYDFGY